MCFIFLGGTIFCLTVKAMTQHKFALKLFRPTAAQICDRNTGIQIRERVSTSHSSLGGSPAGGMCIVTLQQVVK